VILDGKVESTQSGHSGTKREKFMMLPLYDISQEIPYDPITRHEAELLSSYMKSFKFLCSTVIWYNILNKVNIASKVLQKKEVDLSAAVEILTNTLDYLKKYRSDDVFSSALIDTKEITSDLDVEPTFCRENSIVHNEKKKQSDYENSDEPMQNSEIIQS
jgi:hypothetical protein